MNAKETDQRVNNINAMGCARVRKNYLMMPRPFPAADQERPSLEAWRGGQNTRRTHGRQAHTWRTSFGGADSKGGLKRCTHGEHMEDKVWRRGQSGLKVDTSGHMADKLQGRGQSISRPAFFPKREPHSKLFREKPSKKPSLGTQPCLDREQLEPQRMKMPRLSSRCCKMFVNVLLALGGDASPALSFAKAAASKEMTKINSCDL